MEPIITKHIYSLCEAELLNLLKREGEEIISVNYPCDGNVQIETKEIKEPKAKFD